MQLSNLNLRKGSVVFKSVKGANGFYYPSTSESLVISESCLASKKTGWLSFQGLVPVVVPSSSLDRESRYDSKNRMIVWISSKKFQNSKNKRG